MTQPAIGIYEALRCDPQLTADVFVGVDRRNENCTGVVFFCIDEIAWRVVVRDVEVGITFPVSFLQTAACTFRLAGCFYLLEFDGIRKFQMAFLLFETSR